MEINYYILAASLRKATDRAHFINKNEHHKGEDYFSKTQLMEKLDFNSIGYRELYEEDYGVIKNNILLIEVQGCLEERLLELIDKSVFRILMKTGKPEDGIIY